jgi:hypothetical protein
VTQKKKPTGDDLLDRVRAVEPSEAPVPKQLILDRWEVTHEEFTGIVEANPSLRGVTLGYVAEHKFHTTFLNDRRISRARKDDDHDRKRKGDRTFEYRGHSFIVEVKSLQTNSVRKEGNGWFGKSQVDASDSREVTFANKSKLKTTCLLRNEFDVLAVNCYAFGGSWQFAFALNRDLPKNTYRKYTPAQRAALLPTLIPVTWPPQEPFVGDLFLLLDRLAAEKDSGLSPEVPDVPVASIKD